MPTIIKPEFLIFKLFNEYLVHNEPSFGQNGTLFVLPSIVLAYASPKNQLVLVIRKKRQ
jgi:hypothetical protein